MKKKAAKKNKDIYSVVGYLPELRYLRVSDILIPEDFDAPDEYQRHTNEKKVKSRLKKNGFDLGMVKAISVARRPDGKYVVYDGLHTLKKFKLMGFEEVPCSIQPCDNIEREAFLFESMNTELSKPTAHEKFKASVIHGQSQDAIDAIWALDQNGITLSKDGYSENSTQSIGVIRNNIKRHGKERVRKALLMSKTIFKDKKRMTSSIIHGMCSVVSKVEKAGIDFDAFCSSVSSHGHTAEQVLDSAIAIKKVSLQKNKTEKDCVTEVIMGLYTEESNVSVIK